MISNNKYFVTIFISFIFFCLIYLNNIKLNDHIHHIIKFIFFIYVTFSNFKNNFKLLKLLKISHLKFYAQ